MKRFLLALLLIAGVTALAGCAHQADQEEHWQQSLSDKEAEIAALRKELSTASEQINMLKQEVNRLAQDLMHPHGPNEPRVAAGEGGGRFVVVPNRVRPGDTIGIYCDYGDGLLVIRHPHSPDGDITMRGPDARSFVQYTFPDDAAPGTYKVMLTGGNWSGMADIVVEAEGK